MSSEKKPFKMPSTFPAMFGVLLIISLICGALLALTYASTKDAIASVEVQKTKAAFSVVLPGFDNDPLADRMESKTEAGVLLYPLKKGGELLGYAVATFTERGYAGRIELMVGIDRDGKITAYKETKAAETPGLGSNLASPDFKKQFMGIDPVSFKLEVKKDGGDVDAIAASTITSRAICDAINRAVRAWKETVDAEK